MSGPSADGGGSKYGHSRYQLMREMLASWLDTTVDNVDIFTVLNHPFRERTIDVRYSAHGSPYYRPTKLNGLMALYKSRVSIVSNCTNVTNIMRNCTKH